MDYRNKYGNDTVSGIDSVSRLLLDFQDTKKTFPSLNASKTQNEWSHRYKFALNISLTGQQWNKSGNDKTARG